MRLSIVVPALNEGHRIVQTLETISTFCKKVYEEWEILVVDDGSSDDTSRVVSAYAGARLLRNEVNRGKGYSVRRGILEAKHDPVLFSDADMSTPIEEVLNLQEALGGTGALGGNGETAVAIASRIPASGKEVHRASHRRLMALVFRTIVKAVALRGFHDTQCGFKLFRLPAAREIFSLQRIDRWGFDVEVLYLARKLGYKIVEVPVAWEESAESRLRATTPLTMIGDLLKVRWNDLRGRYRQVKNPVTPEETAK